MEIESRDRTKQVERMTKERAKGAGKTRKRLQAVYVCLGGGKRGSMNRERRGWMQQ